MYTCVVKPNNSYKIYLNKKILTKFANKNGKF